MVCCKATCGVAFIYLITTVTGISGVPMKEELGWLSMRAVKPASHGDESYLMGQ